MTAVLRFAVVAVLIGFLAWVLINVVAWFQGLEAALR